MIPKRKRSLSAEAWRWPIATTRRPRPHSMRSLLDSPISPKDGTAAPPYCGFWASTWLRSLTSSERSLLNRAILEHSVRSGSRSCAWVRARPPNAPSRPPWRSIPPLRWRATTLRCCGTGGRTLRAARIRDCAPGWGCRRETIGKQLGEQAGVVVDVDIDPAREPGDVADGRLPTLLT